MATATSKTQARLRREADEKFREAFDAYMFECLQQKGQKLPTENALAKKFGVTRYKVRKEMERLNQAGVLQRVKHGGTTVTQVTPTDFAQRLDMQFRVAHFSAATYAQTTDCLLTGIVPLWLEVLKADDLAKLDTRLDEMAEEVSLSYARSMVMDFLGQLVERVENPILQIYFSVLRARYERGDAVSLETCKSLVESCHDLIKEIKKGRRKRVVAILNTILAQMPLADQPEGTDDVA